MAVTLPIQGSTYANTTKPGEGRVEPPLELGGYGRTGSDPDGRGRRRLTLPASIVIHGAAAVALIVVPLLGSDTLPEPQSSVRAFFAEPMSVPPPPPPTAARPAAAPRVTPKPQPRPQAFVAPVEVPTQITPEQALDLGDDAGAPGGVDGGVPGGVVGGIVGGLPEAPPPPVAPVRVGGSVREPRRVSAVPPVYPDIAAKARLTGVVVIEATINERGRVESVNLVQGAPLFSDAALEAVKKWVYTPTLVNGVPTPVIMTVTVHFRLTGPAA